MPTNLRLVTVATGASHLAKSVKGGRAETACNGRTVEIDTAATAPDRPSCQRCAKRWSDMDADNRIAAMGVKEPRRPTVVRGGKKDGPVPARPAVRFFHDGKPMPDSQNKLASVAYQFTKGIGGADVKRIGTADLVALLAKAGITDPAGSAWEHTLPNGVKIEARVVEAPAVETRKAS